MARQVRMQVATTAQVIGAIATAYAVVISPFGKCISGSSNL